MLLNQDSSVETKAHLRLVSLEGSGAWLHAPPSRDSAQSFKGELFRIALKRRLRMRLLDAPALCPCCGLGLDVYMDHALVCSCSGDRTLRHNALRNLVCYIAAQAGLWPEKEKAGMLPPRPEADTIRGEDLHSGRRPADIWIPQWQSGGPAAWDFAVTSGLRADVIFQTADEPGVAAARYEQYKRDYLTTSQSCRDRGLEFLPLVAEAHGGSWGPTARAVWHFLAKAWSAASGKDMSFVSADLAQRTSTTLQRENTCAILRRMTPAGRQPDEACAQSWADNEDAQSVASGD